MLNFRQSYFFKLSKRKYCIYFEIVFIINKKSKKFGGTMKGKIIKGIGGFYYVKTTDGLIECKARGNLDIRI